jgi:beta-N-acetylhexosaminidase
MNAKLDLSEFTKNVGQLFIGGIPGPEVDDSTISLLRDYHIGGIIMFSRNVRDPLQLARLCMDLQKASVENSGLPLFLAVDQEGGKVARLKSPFSQFPGNEAIGKSQNPEQSAIDFAATTAREMTRVGLNMDMAPVVDVAQPYTDSHLAGRTFSDDPSLVAALGQIVIETLQGNGVMAVAKHFPGLGSADLDPHRDLPTITASPEEMESVHLPPFARAIEAGVSAVMVSHAVYPAFEPAMPATLSRTIVGDLLRKKMNFDGLILSDDLEMGAIMKARGLPQGAADAFEAGVDLLLICSSQECLIASIELLQDKLVKGDIPEERLKESLDRIMRYKRRFLHPAKTISLEAVEEYFERLRS